MTDEEIKEIIKLTAKQTVHEFKKEGLMRKTNDANYSEASEILRNYYANGNKDASVNYAIQGLRFDPYFRVIHMYFGENRTLESIAEELGVDVSTVVRNKKRLCLELYKELN